MESAQDHPADRMRIAARARRIASGASGFAPATAATAAQDARIRTTVVRPHERDARANRGFRLVPKHHCEPSGGPLGSRSPMRIAIPLETAPREQRVALIPDAAARLVKAGFTVAVQAGAGERAGHVDDTYRQAGASVEPDLASTVAGASALLVVREPSAELLRALPSGCAVLGLIGRGGQSPLVDLALERRLTLFSLNALPRISRAQKMDALSSMAGVAGYKAVLMAANLSGKFFPLLMTAAGTVAPSRVLVLGAGVAGLQAIATARRLGAVVEAFDVRPAVKEEVQSLGASFLELPLGDAAVGTGGYAREMDESRNEQVRQWIASRLGNTDV